MDFREVVQNRKSVRAYKKQAVEEEKIDKILELVNLAPSAGNLQAYKIFVVKDKNVKRELTLAAMGQECISTASIALVFCAVPEESAIKYGERGRKLYAIQDATIACAYAQLAATEMGLSSCWVGAFDEHKVQNILNTSLLPVAILPIGYPAETPSRPPRKPLAETTNFIN